MPKSYRDIITVSMWGFIHLITGETMTNVYAVTAVYKDTSMKPEEAIFYDKAMADQMLTSCLTNRSKFSCIVSCESSFEMYMRMKVSMKGSDKGTYRVTIGRDDGLNEVSTEESFIAVRKKLAEELGSLSNRIVDVKSKSIFSNQDGSWVTIYCREVKHKG